MCPANDDTEFVTGPEADDLTFILQIALSHIQDREAEPEVFLDWMREFAPRIAPAVFPFESDHENGLAAYWLG